MANKPLKTIKFPGLPDIYTIPEVDASLATTGKAADAKAVGDALGDLQDTVESFVSGMSDDAKEALLSCFEHVAWVDSHGQDYYDALRDALYADDSKIESITCVYNQNKTIYSSDSLDTLKADLVVTAHMQGGTTETIYNGYTLSGSLVTGTSTITVSYKRKTASFDVIVGTPLYNWDFTKSLKDTVASKTVTLTGATRDSNGILFNGATEYAVFGNVLGFGKTLEIDLGNCVRNTSTWPDSSTTGTNGLVFWTNQNENCGFAWDRNFQYWGFYSNADSRDGINIRTGSGWKHFRNFTSTDDMSNVKLKFAIDSNGIIHCYFNGTEIKPIHQVDEPSITRYPAVSSVDDCNYFRLGSSKSAYPAFRDMIVKAVRIYGEG